MRERRTMSKLFQGSLAVALVLASACDSKTPPEQPNALEPSGKGAARVIEEPKVALEKPPAEAPPAAAVPAANDVASAPAANAAPIDVKDLGDLSVPTMDELKAQVAEKITPENLEAELKRLKGEISGGP